MSAIVAVDRAQPEPDCDGGDEGDLGLSLEEAHVAMFKLSCIPRAAVVFAAATIGGMVPMGAATPATFTLTAGALSISAPVASVSLGSPVASISAGTISGSLGVVTVT